MKLDGGGSVINRATPSCYGCCQYARLQPCLTLRIFTGLFTGCRLPDQAGVQSMLKIYSSHPRVVQEEHSLGFTGACRKLRWFTDPLGSALATHEANLIYHADVLQKNWESINSNLIMHLKGNVLICEIISGSCNLTRNVKKNIFILFFSEKIMIKNGLWVALWLRWLMWWTAIVSSICNSLRVNREL